MVAQPNPMVTGKDSHILPPQRQAHTAPLRSYSVELPADLLDPYGELLDWLFGYTFDSLGVVHLTLRITPPNSIQSML